MHIKYFLFHHFYPISFCSLVLSVGKIWRGRSPTISVGRGPARRESTRGQSVEGRVSERSRSSIVPRSAPRGHFETGVRGKNPYYSSPDHV